MASIHPRYSKRSDEAYAREAEREIQRRRANRLKAPAASALHEISLGVSLEAWERIHPPYRQLLEAVQFSLGERADAGEELREESAVDVSQLLIVATAGPWP